MSEALRSEIAAHFPEAVSRIFGEKLCLAFVFGGFGKGYGGPGHDIDMFVLLDELVPEARDEFVAWYLEFHARLGLPPDREYPGELVLLDDLEGRIAYLERAEIRPVIESQYEYEAILWVDALSENKLAFVPGTAIDEHRGEQLLKRAYSLMLRWRSQVVLWRPEPISVLRELDLRRLFKGHVRYLKRPSVPRIAADESPS